MNRRVVYVVANNQLVEQTLKRAILNHLRNCTACLLTKHNTTDRQTPMWLHTKYGFLSVVSARQGDGSFGQPVDPTRLMVRARVREHLISLKERFPLLIGDCEIREFAHSDYPFRIFVAKAVWSEVLVALNDEIDYDNFKSEVARFQGREGAAYEHALHEVWAVMRGMQK